jgi:Sensors of blue-light using FAD
MLLSIAYSSEIAAPSDTILEDIALKAAHHNKQQDITGLLLFIDGLFIQVIEGAEANVVPLMEKITRDVRHSRMKLLSQTTKPKREFDDWSMAVVACEKSVQLKRHLEKNLGKRIAKNSYVELMSQFIKPEVSADTQQVVVLAKSPMWHESLFAYLKSKGSTHLGSVSYKGASTQFSENLGSSDFLKVKGSENLKQQLLLSTLTFEAARSPLSNLILSGATTAVVLMSSASKQEIVDEMHHIFRSAIRCSITTLGLIYAKEADYHASHETILGLADQYGLRCFMSAHRLLEGAKTWAMVEYLVDQSTKKNESGYQDTALQPSSTILLDHANEVNANPYDSLEVRLDLCMTIDGASCAMMINFLESRVLAKRGNFRPFLPSVSTNSELMRKTSELNQAQSHGGVLQDILITLPTQYHLLRPIAKVPGVFMYLVLENANLALAQIKLNEIDASIEL